MIVIGVYFSLCLEDALSRLRYDSSVRGTHPTKPDCFVGDDVGCYFFGNKFAISYIARKIILKIIFDILENSFCSCCGFSVKVIILFSFLKCGSILL